MEPPSDDHAAAIDLAADPPPLILRVEVEGSMPMCLQADTKPEPSVFVPDQWPPDLISWFTAPTPLGLLTPRPDGAECLRGEVHETQISPSIWDAFSPKSSMLLHSMYTCCASIPRNSPTIENILGVGEWEIGFPAMPHDPGLTMALATSDWR